MKNTMYVGVGGYQTSPKIRKYILDVLDNERLSYGPYIAKFESEFAMLHQCSYGIMCNSGTSALQVALQTLKIHHNWKEGDEVILPATTFVATANIIRHNGMTPVFVDVESNYFGINTELIEEKITDRTRCIIPVHLFGMPCQMDRVMEIARKHDLKVIEDSCETMFAKFDNQVVGSFGDMACFSTYIAHILVTGVGGVVTTSNPEYAVTLRSLINHGRDSIYISIDDAKGKTPERLKKIIERRFSFVHSGHSFRVTEMEGAMGLAQLEDWQTNIRNRQRNASFLNQHLKEFEEHLQLPEIRPLADHVFMMYPIVLKNSLKHDLCAYLENLGVETRDMLPLINQPIYQEEFLNSANDYPVSTKIVESGFYIGSHPYLTPEMLDHIVFAFKSYFHSKSVIPLKTVLVGISSVDTQTTETAFAQLNLSLFDRIIIFDAYHTCPTHFTELKSVEIIPLKTYSMTQLYQTVIDSVTEDVVVFYHMDGSQNPDDMSSLVAHSKMGYDLVVASRFMLKGSRYDSRNLIPFRGLGNRLITMLLNLFFDANLGDSYQPFRCASLKFLKAAKLDSEMLFNYQMSLKAVLLKQNIIEIPTKEKSSISPKNFKYVLWVGFLAIYMLVREKCRPHFFKIRKWIH
jgi:perosamine synthetase